MIQGHLQFFSILTQNQRVPGIFATATALCRGSKRKPKQAVYSILLLTAYRKAGQPLMPSRTNYNKHGLVGKPVSFILSS